MLFDNLGLSYIFNNRLHYDTCVNMAVQRIFDQYIEWWFNLIKNLKKLEPFCLVKNAFEFEPYNDNIDNK